MARNHAPSEPLLPREEWFNAELHGATSPFDQLSQPRTTTAAQPRPAGSAVSVPLPRAGRGARRPAQAALGLTGPLRQRAGPRAKVSHLHSSQHRHHSAKEAAKLTDRTKRR
jgi:hypothetical protein